MDKLPSPETRKWYAAKAIEHNWSRNVLVMQIETRLLEGSGQEVTNFDARLPASQSDLARESLKDPYRFDFLSLTDESQEREIENALVRHVTEFLLELGAGSPLSAARCCWMWGTTNSSSTFCSTTSNCAATWWSNSKAENSNSSIWGQLGFYLTTVDRQLKSEQDNPTVGLLLCKSKNRVVAEYALGDKSQPMGVAEYKLLESLPENLQSSLPSIEQIERELGGEHE